MIRPRRLTPPAPLGSMLKRFDAPAPRRFRKDDGERDPAYLENVRACPCLSCGMEPTEAAHVRFSSAAYGKTSGMNKKPEDRFALPLCAECHRLARDAQHNRGEVEFWHALGINPLAVCVALYGQREDLVAMRSVIFLAIAQRSAA